MKFECAAFYAGEEILAQPRNQNRQGAEASRTERTSERTQCKSKVWTQKQEWQSARHCPEQLCPCPCLVPSPVFGLCSRPPQWHRQPGSQPPVRVHLAS